MNNTVPGKYYRRYGDILKASPIFLAVFITGYLGETQLQAIRPLLRPRSVYRERFTSLIYLKTSQLTWVKNPLYCEIMPEHWFSPTKCTYVIPLNNPKSSHVDPMVEAA